MKTAFFITLITTSLGTIVPAIAQHQHHDSSPYKDQVGRPVKALSSEDVDNYLKGRGMGLAKAAELNNYPGPMHVLEFAEQLKLNDAQKREIQLIYNRMHEQAVALGRQIIEKEKAVDDLFARREATPGSLHAALYALGQLQSELRVTHLMAHLDTTGILSDGQVEQYGKLRGYKK